MELFIPNMSLNLQEKPVKRYCQNFIQKKLIPEKLLGSEDKGELQRRKFKLLSELINDLFKYKDSQRCYISISNLVIMCLISFDEDQPIDVFSEKKSCKSRNKNDELKKILTRELDISDLPN